MRSIVHDNVNGAFQHGLHLLSTEGIREETRNGPALVHPEPVCITYRRPNERVLFSRARRANPFFHLFEAFWMLAGRRDAAFLNQYVSDFGARFAEEDGALHGAYGHRWRRHFSTDQLLAVIDVLGCSPSSRQAVVAMWDPVVDLDAVRKDLPCNTHMYFRTQLKPDGTRTLDMTVCCRSNDAIWGLFGANAVHFSVLQEYMAHFLGFELGAMHTLANNCHVYESTLHLWDRAEPPHDLYGMEEVAVTPLFAGVESYSAFRFELDEWLEAPTIGGVAPLFHGLLAPMARVHATYKTQGRVAAAALLPQVQHIEWREAARLWLSQRKERVG